MEKLIFTFAFQWRLFKEKMGHKVVPIHASGQGWEEQGDKSSAFQMAGEPGSWNRQGDNP